VAFAEALARLLEDRSLRSNLAEGARATAECRGWGPIFDRLIEDYRRVATAEPDDRAA
jgi:glycosyltransferase involved in cell wall biosynthesis